MKAVKKLVNTRLLLLPLGVSLFIYLTSGWFRGIIFENIVIALVFLVSLILYILFYHYSHKVSLKLLAFIYTILLFLQFQTTNIKNTYSFTPSEMDQQIQRMNYYPPDQARLGYILENKREVRLVERFTENFIEVVDFNTYFPDYFPLFSLPFFFIGIFHFVKETVEAETKNMFIVFCSLFTVFCLSFLGIHGKYGPFLPFPFIGLFIYMGIDRLLHPLKRARNDKHNVNPTNMGIL